MQALAAPSSARVQVALSLRSSDLGSTTSIAISLRCDGPDFTESGSARLVSLRFAADSTHKRDDSTGIVNAIGTTGLLVVSGLVVLDRFLFLPHVRTLHVLAAAGTRIAGRVGPAALDAPVVIRLPGT